MVKEMEGNRLNFSHVSQSMNRFNRLWLNIDIVVILMSKEQNNNIYLKSKDQLFS